MKLKTQKIIGIEFGAKSVRIVKTDRRGHVVRAGRAEMPNDRSVIAEAGTDPDQQNYDLLSTIRRAARNARIRGGPCAVCISGPDIILRHFNMPYMDDAALRQNVMHEIQTYIALSLDNYYVDHKVHSHFISEDGALMLKVLVCAAAKERVDTITALLKNAGFKPRFVDVMENAREKLLNFLTRGDLNQFDPAPVAEEIERKAEARKKEAKLREKQKMREQAQAGKHGLRRTDYQKEAKAETKEEIKEFDDKLNAVIIYFGASFTHVSIVLGRRYYVSRYLNNGQKIIDQVISDTMPCDISLVPAMRVSENFFSEADLRPVAQKVRDQVDALASEITSVIEYSIYRERSRKIDSVYVSGSLTSMQGLTEYLDESFGLPVYYLDGMVRELFRVPELRNQDISIYTNALGATLREVRE